MSGIETIGTVLVLAKAIEDAAELARRNRHRLARVVERVAWFADKFRKLDGKERALGAEDAVLLRRFEALLQELLAFVQQNDKKGWVRRLYSAGGDKDAIDDFNDRLDRARDDLVFIFVVDRPLPDAFGRNDYVDLQEIVEELRANNAAMREELTAAKLARGPLLAAVEIKLQESKRRSATGTLQSGSTQSTSLGGGSANSSSGPSLSMKRSSTYSSGAREFASGDFQPPLVDLTKDKFPSLVVGEGAFATVFKCRWEKRSIPVAVKVLKVSSLSKKAEAQLRNEVEVLSGLEHCPNVIAVYGYYSEPGRCLCLVTTFAPGGSLRAKLGDPAYFNALDWTKRWSLCQDIAAGMKWLHGADPMIIHRDLKCDNVLLNRHGEAMIADFGCALAKDETFTQTGVTMATAGSTPWMPPEAFASSTQGWEGDVYAFAMVMWEIATGEIPWAGTNAGLIPGFVKEGRRPDLTPHHALNAEEPQYVAMMQRCWSQDHRLRPMFSVLRAECEDRLKNTGVKLALASSAAPAVAPQTKKRTMWQTMLAGDQNVKAEKRKVVEKTTEPSPLQPMREDMYALGDVEGRVPPPPPPPPPPPLPVQTTSEANKPQPKPRQRPPSRWETARAWVLAQPKCCFALLLVVFAVVLGIALGVSAQSAAVQGSQAPSFAPTLPTPAPSDVPTLFPTLPTPAPNHAPTLFPTVAPTSLLKQTAKLPTGSGSSATAKQGAFVAIAGDERTILYGGYNDSNGAGAAWVFTLSAGSWVQQGPKLQSNDLVSDPAPRFGSFVALAGDGNTAIIGGPFSNVSIGAAWIFVRLGDTWTQQGKKLVGTGVVGPFSRQGCSVGISTDGQTAVVGGPADNNDMGSLWIFTQSGATWTQQGDKLVGNDANRGSAGGAVFQGYMVAISGDGNTVISGGLYDSAYVGAAWIFVRSGTTTWTQQGNKLVANDMSGTSFQGCSVALSANGNTAAVGAWGDGKYVGASVVWVRGANLLWTQQGSKLIGSQSVVSPQQGVYMSMTADGNTFVVGGIHDNSGIGAVWVFVRNQSNLWNQQGMKLVGTPFTEGSKQGAVAISASGNTAVIGGFGDTNGLGSVWVFRR